VSLDEVVIIAAFLGVPLMTLAHELGHAAAALHYTQGRVGIRVGSAQGVMKLYLGRLLIGFSLLGAGGFCRREQQGSRREQLIIVLAGPAMSAVVAVMLYGVGAAASGNAQAAIYTVAVVSGLDAVLNLIPRRPAWNPITKGIPSDGLKAWCLLRDKPVPPADPTRGRKGLKDSLNAQEVVTVLMMNVAFLVFGLGLATSKLGGAGAAFYVALLLQTALSGSGKHSPATAPQKTTPTGAQVGRNQLAIPLGSAPAAGHTTRLATTTKTCPKCGAEVQRGASLCYCLHQFA
jgi:hypothetical protein